MWSMEKVRAVRRAFVKTTVDLEMPVELAMMGAAAQLKLLLHHELGATVVDQDIQLEVLGYDWGARVAYWGACWRPRQRPAMLDGKVWVAPAFFCPPHDPIFVRHVIAEDFRLFRGEGPTFALPRPQEVRCSGWDPLQRAWVYESGR